MFTFWQGFEKRAVSMATVMALVAKRLALHAGKSRAAADELAERIVEAYVKKHPAESGMWWKRMDNFNDIMAHKKHTKGDVELADKMLDWYRREVSL